MEAQLKQRFEQELAQLSQKLTTEKLSFQQQTEAQLKKYACGPWRPRGVTPPPPPAQGGYA